MTQRPDLNQLSADQLRVLAMELFDRMDGKYRELHYTKTLNEKLTYELALLKRRKFARRSEQLDAVQGQLLDELIDSDIAAIEAELAKTQTPAEAGKSPRSNPRGFVTTGTPSHLDSARSGQHAVPLWLPAQAHWRRH